MDTGEGLHTSGLFESTEGGDSWSVATTDTRIAGVADDKAKTRLTVTVDSDIVRAITRAVRKGQSESVSA